MSIMSDSETKPSWLFKKGQSGNPGGIPREIRIARNLAAKMSPRAMKTLEKWMDGDDARASIAACLAILNRGLGKEAAMRELYPLRTKAEDKIPEVSGLSDEQLEKILAIAREGLA